LTELTPTGGDQVDLSCQQLLDCDVNSINEGCMGGNPEIAYPYIISNGLTSQSNYPFIDSSGQVGYLVTLPVRKLDLNRVLHLHSYVVLG